MAANKLLISIPTYNEAENVKTVSEQINELKLGADILFVDDNSPDGTGAIINEMSKHNPNIHVIHRPRKQGIGSAHLDGIRWAYNNGYKTLITMDCDFSHLPAYLTRFVENSSNCDVVVGSRYKQKSSLSEWNLLRKTLTHVGHFLTKSMLKMPYDATGAYRLYNLDRIPIELFDLVRSMGYSFLFESLYIIHVNGYSIKELPINLPARTYGHSKMTIKDIAQSLLTLIDIYLKSFRKSLKINKK